MAEFRFTYNCMVRKLPVSLEWFQIFCYQNLLDLFTTGTECRAENTQMSAIF